MADELFDDPRIPDAFDDLPVWSAQFGIPLLARVPLVRGASVLDVGCGGEFPLLELARMLGPSGRVIGVDPWGHALRRAAFKRAVSATAGAQLVRGDGSALPLRSASIDVIVSNLGLNNVADPPAVLAELRRVARPGAAFVLASNIRGHMAEVYGIFREVLVARGLEARLPALEAHEAHRGTVESISAMLAAAGFRVETAELDRFTMRALDARAFFDHWLVRVGFLPAWRAVLSDAAEADDVIDGIRARLDERAAAEGELRVTVPRLIAVARAA